MDGILAAKWAADSYASAVEAGNEQFELALKAMENAETAVDRAAQYLVEAAANPTIARRQELLRQDLLRQDLRRQDLLAAAETLVNRARENVTNAGASMGTRNGTMNGVLNARLCARIAAAAAARATADDHH